MYNVRGNGHSIQLSPPLPAIYVCADRSYTVMGIGSVFVSLKCMFIDCHVCAYDLIILKQFITYLIAIDLSIPTCRMVKLLVQFQPLR